MPRKTGVQKQIRAERLKKRKCYDCGRKLYNFNKRTRCYHCLKLEQMREKRRKRKRDILSRMKHFFYYCSKTNKEGDILLSEKG